MTRRLTRRALLVRATIAAGLLSTVGAPLGERAYAAPKIPVRDYDDGPILGPSVSAPRALPAGTSHVGIHWRGEARRATSVAARVRTPSGWSEWVDLTIDEHPFGRDETFTALLDVRGGDAIQYRATLPPGRRLDRVVVTAIGADEPVATSPFMSTALAAGPSGSFTPPDAGRRPVYTREDWGCDESLGLTAGGTRSWPAMFVPTKKLIVHHTATGNRYTTGAAEVRAIYAYHAKTQGWGDIGYTALVDRVGNVYEGRRGREGSPREVLSGGVVAGHCYHHNYGTTGPALIGDFSQRKLDPANANDRAMLAALEDLTVWECHRAGMRADGSSSFLRSDDLWRDAMPTITGHKDSFSTACPGKWLYPYVTGTLRSNVAARLARFITATAAVSRSSSGRELVAPAGLTFAWSGSKASRAEWRLEGWRKINEFDIAYWTPSGWATAEPSGWTAASLSGEAAFGGLTPGHYTFHVRVYDTDGKLSAVEANDTVLIR